MNMLSGELFIHFFVKNRFHEEKLCSVLFIQNYFLFIYRDLKILIDVDISANNLTKLQPKTFDGNNNLQIIKAAQNPLRELMPYQFPPLKNLKMLDFSHCELQTIDKMAFHNLGQSMETIYLNNNQLRYFFLRNFNISFTVFIALFPPIFKTLYIQFFFSKMNCCFKNYFVFTKKYAIRGHS